MKSSVFVGNVSNGGSIKETEEKVVETFCEGIWAENEYG
jgi:hypothetical protein